MLYRCVLWLTAEIAKVESTLKGSQGDTGGQEMHGNAGMDPEISGQTKLRFDLYFVKKTDRISKA
jgi:hypothetical protein